MSFINGIKEFNKRISVITIIIGYSLGSIVPQFFMQNPGYKHLWWYIFMSVWFMFCYTCAVLIFMLIQKLKEKKSNASS